jgi:hypothetical protein
MENPAVTLKSNTTLASFLNKQKGLLSYVSLELPSKYTDFSRWGTNFVINSYTKPEESQEFPIIHSSPSYNKLLRSCLSTKSLKTPVSRQILAQSKPSQKLKAQDLNLLEIKSRSLIKSSKFQGLDCLVVKSIKPNTNQTSQSSRSLVKPDVQSGKLYKTTLDNNKVFDDLKNKFEYNINNKVVDIEESMASSKIKTNTITKNPKNFGIKPLRTQNISDKKYSSKGLNPLIINKLRK